jgi:hypothetical protein
MLTKRCNDTQEHRKESLWYSFFCAHLRYFNEDEWSFIDLFYSPTKRKMFKQYNIK